MRFGLGGCGLAFVLACGGGGGFGGPAAPDPNVITTYWGTDITSSTVWSADMSPILVRNSITVGSLGGEPAILTIEPGCEIRFVTNALLIINDAGAIEAVGTAELPIRMRYEDDFNDDFSRWSGLSFGTGESSPPTRLEHVVIEHAWIGIDIFSGHPTLRNVEVRDSHDHGIEVRSPTGGFAPDSSSITSTGASGVGLRMDLNDLGQIPLGCDFSGNGRGGVEVRAQSSLATLVESSLTLHDIRASYVFQKELRIGGPSSPVLTLDAGAVISAPMVIVGGNGQPGGLRANGVADNPVSFIGDLKDVPRGNTFGGIKFGNDAIESESVLVHANVIGAGLGIYVADAATVTLDHVRIEATHTGLRLDGALSPASTGLDIESGLWPVIGDVNGLATLATSSRYSGSMPIPVEGTWLWRSGTWPTATYAVGTYPGELVIAGTLTIEPGTQVYVANTHIRVADFYGEGNLVAIGTAADPIVFTGQANTPGSWEGISFDAPLDGRMATSVLQHVVVENAGGGQSSAAISVSSGNSGLSITSSTVTGSAQWGIAASCVVGDGPTIANITYGGNAAGDLRGPGCP